MNLDICQTKISAFNALWPSDAVLRCSYGLTLAQGMACCLAAPRHNCWLPITPKAVSHYNWFGKYTFNIKYYHINELNVGFAHIHFGDILLKGPYPPCLRMADRALLAGYPRFVRSQKLVITVSANDLPPNGERPSAGLVISATLDIQFSLFKCLSINFNLLIWLNHSKWRTWCH